MNIVKWLIIGLLSSVSLVWSFARVEVNWPWFGMYPNLDPDSLLYLRWLEQGLLQGKLLTKDLYLSFPQPFEIQLSPLYREFLHRFSLLLSIAHLPPGIAVESVLGIIPPLTGILIQGLILITLHLRKAPFALVLFTGFSAIPGFSHFSTFDYMQLDHHWLEVGCIALWIILADWFYEHRTGSLKILGGVVIALFQGAWSGSPQFVALSFGLLFLLWIGKVRQLSALMEYFSSTMLIGSGIMALYLLKHPEIAADTPFSGFGWVQVGLIGIAGIAAFLLEKGKGWWPDNVGKRLVATVGILALGLGFIHLMAPKSLEMAANFFAKRNKVIQTISEMRPILNFHTLAGIHGQLSSQMAYWGIFPLFLGLPLLWLSGKTGNKPGKLLVGFGIVAYLLALYQIRFSRWLAPFIPSVTGVMLFTLYRFASGGRHRNNTLAAAVVVFPFLMFQIGIDFSVAKVGSPITKTSMEGISWLRDRTPPTSGYADEKEPEYGIVSFWDQGNAITYLARRPVAVSNTLVGFRNMVKVFFAKDEREAYRFCRRQKYRYLYLSMLPGDEEYFRYLKGVADEGGGSVEFDFRHETALGDADATWKSLYFWLYGSLGLKPFGADNAVSRHFRIVFLSSDGTDGKNSSIKIAEAVPGAVITGSADPGSRVRLGLPIQFGRKVLPYLIEATADASGTFRTSVPYPTEFRSGGVKTDAFYTLTHVRDGLATTSRVVVPEAAVVDGGEIRIE